MELNLIQNFNDFSSGHLVINEDRKIVFCNNFINNLSGQSHDEIINTVISKYLTKASSIFLDSYIYPLLMNELVAQEIQITWVAGNGEKIPIIANIKLGANNMSYWSLYVCTNRDKLQSELLKANKKLEQQSQELFLLATTDPLTGLLNRRELYIQAEKIYHQAARNSSTFALLFIDIDFFKSVNDKYGHQMGDKVLLNLADTLNENRRFNDVVARIGGEEFVLLLPDIDKENAFVLAENLRKTVEKKSIDGIGIAISIGLSISQKDEKVEFEALLQLADEALYHSKNTGRNKTSVAPV